MTPNGYAQNIRCILVHVWRKCRQTINDLTVHCRRVVRSPANVQTFARIARLVHTPQLPPVRPCTTLILVMQCVIRHEIWKIQTLTRQNFPICIRLVATPQPVAVLALKHMSTPFTGVDIFHRQRPRMLLKRQTAPSALLHSHRGHVIPQEKETVAVGERLQLYCCVQQRWLASHQHAAAPTADAHTVSSLATLTA